LAASSIRGVHWIISGALERAKRWKWIAVNVAEQAEPPAQPAPKPRPPTSQEAARIVAEAWKDPGWGMLIWLAMTTGARRGELCALRWSDVSLDHGVIGIERAIAKVDGALVEQDTRIRGVSVWAASAWNSTAPVGSSRSRRTRVAPSIQARPRSGIRSLRSVSGSRPA
jgi:integrase